MPGSDPTDINRGIRFVFLNQVANERMRRDKRKVRYIFEEPNPKKKMSKEDDIFKKNHPLQMKK